MSALWLDQIQAEYQSGAHHAFILSGNIADWMDQPGVSLPAAVSDLGLRLPMSQAKQTVPPQTRRILLQFGMGQGWVVGVCQPLAMPTDKNEVSALAADTKKLVERFWLAMNRSPQDLPNPADPAASVNFVQDTIETRMDLLVLIQDADALAPASTWATMPPGDRSAILGLRDLCREDPGNLCLILATPTLSGVHECLREPVARTVAVNIPWPDESTRIAFASAMFAGMALESDMPAEELGRTTAGLTLLDLEDIGLLARQQGALTGELVSRRRRELAAQEFAGVIELLEPTMGLASVGGLANIKMYLREAVITPIRSGDRSLVPMGIGCFGPPGTGKTLTMLAAAKDSGFNAVSLNLGSLMGEFVGLSERNLEKALSAIEAMTPVFVLIDEADQQGIGRGEGGDSGTGSRMFRRLLEFMSMPVHRGQIVWFIASNRPDLLDAAFKRPGRIDAKIPFLPPTPAERPGVFQAVASQHGFNLRVKKDEWKALTDNLDRWTGAEMEAAVTKARMVAAKAGRAKITAADLRHALSRLRARTGDVALQTRLALAEVDDLDFLPEGFVEPAEPPDASANPSATPGFRQTRLN